MSSRGPLLLLLLLLSSWRALRSRVSFVDVAPVFGPNEFAAFAVHLAMLVRIPERMHVVITAIISRTPTTTTGTYAKNEM